MNDFKKRVMRLIAVVSVLLFLTSAAVAQNDMRYFITRSGDKLMEGGKEYRFISFNIPNLHLIEDNFPFEATNEWRFPNEFEITDALSSIKQLGGRATRIYVISICKKDGPNPIPCHVKKPGEFNEEAFRALDKVLEVANRVGVRVIIPLVDNWKWWGGAEQYAEYRGRSSEAFWTDPDIIADFKQTISFLINRRNTYTGTLYKDDKAILAWETGNELYSPYSWTKEIAAHIKSLDKNHLVWDGFYIGNKEIQTEALTDPNIDIVSSHHYPAPNRNMLEDIGRFRQQIAGKKVYILGEFGFVPLSDIRKILDAVIQKNISGAMIWSLRFHNRDGGFYWHSEPAGGLLYKAYHYPGFVTGEPYAETELISLMREKAFEIRGLPVPPLETSAPPVLLPIKSVDEISWRGSVGAVSYDVERATKPKGTWTVVGGDVDDTLVQYRPLYSDTSAEPGHSYYYRVFAKNAGGRSAPSNIVGPVRFEEYLIVDELSDYSRTFAHGGSLSLETTNARPYKEDAHRLKGSAESWIVYRTLQPLRSVRVLAFMEGAGQDFEFYLSTDGVNFVKVEPKVSRFPTAVNPYGYKLPVQYELNDLSHGDRFLKIVFKTDAQISRVELQYSR
jgi:mannan endo-1,4-beta-mannosidase